MNSFSNHADYAVRFPLDPNQFLDSWTPGLPKFVELHKKLVVLAYTGRSQTATDRSAQLLHEDRACPRHLIEVIAPAVEAKPNLGIG